MIPESRNYAPMSQPGINDCLGSERVIKKGKAGVYRTPSPSTESF